MRSIHLRGASALSAATSPSRPRPITPPSRHETRRPHVAPSTTTVTIIGAGITGLGAAYYCRKHGIPFVVLEANADVGGVWNSQRWHGARCDSDIIKYSFSFRPWLSDESLRGRADIHAYLRSVATEFHLMERIRFSTTVTRAEFDSGDRTWHITTSRGTYRSRYLLNGNGYMSCSPHVPAFAGMSEFGGEIVHTGALDDRRTFADKRVVLVGSGATAVCCAPVLADVSQSLVMLQRSPSYIYEVSNRIGPFTRLAQRLHRRGITVPVALVRYGLQLKDDVIFVAFRRFPWIGRWIFRRHWKGAVTPDVVRDHFSPRYAPWEQRIPVAIGFREKVRTGAIRMKTAEIDHFSSSGIVLNGGETIPCDVCVLATGYDLDFLKFDLAVDGERVSMDRINFFKGVMLGGVPNYFQPVGVWHSAWTQRSESATRLAIRIMQHMSVNGYTRLSIDRKLVPGVPTITPGYITRHPNLPRLYGSLELPALDRFVSYRFSPSEYRFE